MIKTLKCNKCGKEVEVCLEEAGPHIKATCNECGSYIKFLNQKELKGEENMMEIFYKIESSKYNEGVFFSEYKGVFQLISGVQGREGTNVKKWSYPQIKNSPSAKAIPMGVNIGYRDEAIEMLKTILKELGA